jgi:Raf kinase inhibitor-like YbhB/YbcL family protein
MQLTSPAFTEGELIPTKYGRNFENVNPPLAWSSMPVEARSLVLIMEDPDVPAAAGVPVWDHWVVFNIPPSISEIPEAWDVVGVKGRGTRGELSYGGPKPPDREHRYFFKLLALDTLLDLPEGATKQEVLAAAGGHVIDRAELVGRFLPQGL